MVLVLFGASFRNSTPVLRTSIVLPPGGLPGVSEAQIRALAGTNFKILDITQDRDGAIQRLRDGQLDVVQVLPTDVFEKVRRGENPEIAFESNAIDPMVEGWIQYLAYAEANEVNKAILTQQTAGAQEQAKTVQVKLDAANVNIGTLEGKVSAADQARIQGEMRDLKTALEALQAELPAENAVGGQQAAISDLRSRLTKTIASLDAVDKAIDSGTLQQDLDQLQAARTELNQLDGVIKIFIETPAAVVVAPIKQTYANLRGSAYTAVVFYAPGVLALLIQHTAITLGALALVRERLMGAFEIFRVAPVQMPQLLIGKYLGYMLFIVITAVLLVIAMWLIGVPLLGSIWQFAALVLLLALASLGVGFLISTVAGSDSQAIQLAMITLLLSIFFSGFFISLDSFAPAALVVSYLLPMTHGVAGFKDLMLRGQSPDTLTWRALIIIAVVTFGLVVLLTRRQFQKV
jgi:ABC-2 type transport system permease protein